MAGPPEGDVISNRRQAREGPYGTITWPCRRKDTSGDRFPIELHPSSRASSDPSASWGSHRDDKVCKFAARYVSDLRSHYLDR